MDPNRPRASKTSMADLLLGTVVGERYKLTRRLGEGAMGWVFLAEHVEIGKRLAVKVLRPSLCRQPEAVSRFRREARAASAIGSDHIIEITDFGQTSTGAAYYVMELLQGEDLAKTLKREGKLPWTRARHILRQMCSCLQAAHDQGIVHRDVKPANVYRIERQNDPDFIKVLDFGIARLANPADSVITATGVVMGTPDFMSPEQAQGRKVDHRADIYALGASAYTLVTGKPPFSGKNEYEVIYQHLNAEPSPPSEVAPDAGIPAWVDEAILCAMHKNPEDRFESMSEFLEALEGPPDVREAEAKAKAAETDKPMLPPKAKPGREKTGQVKASGSGSGKAKRAPKGSSSSGERARRSAASGDRKRSRPKKAEPPIPVWLIVVVVAAVVGGLVYALVPR